MIYWIGLSIALISLAIAAFIVIRKFSRLAMIDIDSMSGEREAKIKEELIWQRVARKAKEKSTPLISASAELKRGTGKFFESLRNKAQELEKKYATERIVSKPSKVKPGAENRLKAMLDEAYHLLSEDSPKLAEEKFIEVIGLDNHNVEAYRGLGQVYIKQKQYKEAKEALEFIVKLGKAGDRVYSLLSEIAYLEGDYQTAKQHLRKAISLNKNSALHRIDMAKVDIAQDDRKSAQKNLLKAKEIEPKNPKILDFLIENSIILGIKDEAKAFLKEFQRQNPENPKIIEWKEKIKKM